MTPSVRRAYEWLVIAHLFGAATLAITTRPERSWISMERLMYVVHRGATFVDIRSERVYQMRTVPGSVNIPERELQSRLDELPRDAPVVVFGGIGNESLASYRFLRERGFEVYDLGPHNRMPHGFERHIHPGEATAGHDHPHP